jgi:hypothetical protein
MRQITRDAIEAFMNDQNFNKSNTEVIRGNGIFGTELYLFNNLIAYKKGGEIFMHNRQWLSMTTKERLNGLLIKFGKQIYQKNFVWYIGSKEFVNGKSISYYL